MKAYRFQLPIRPITVKGMRITDRVGVLLERDGQWAEASPLPGFSVESFEDVVAALRDEREAPASLQFALDALATPITETLDVLVNDVVHPDDFGDASLGDASRSAATGNPPRKRGTDPLLTRRVTKLNEKCSDSDCVKLKVGRSADLQVDIDAVHRLRNRLGEESKIRLDANQAWSFTEATDFANAIRDIRIEYIEEPLQDPWELESLFESTGLRYALDESIASIDCITESHPNVTTLICKPTVIGGRNRIEELVATGKPIVFSSSIESGIGIARVAQLAKEFSADVHAGLDTYSWLRADVLLSPLAYSKNRLAVPAHLEVDHSRLERIEL